MARPKGIPHTREWKQRHSRRMRGSGNPMSRKQLTPEQRARSVAGFRRWLKEKYRPYEHLFLWLNKVAKKNQTAVELTYDEFVLFTEIKTCSYCEAGIVWVDQQGRAYNLDRKDNAIGYTKENCVVCCIGCNRIKSNRFSYEEMKELGVFIHDLLARRK